MTPIHEKIEDLFGKFDHVLDAVLKPVHKGKEPGIMKKPTADKTSGQRCEFESKPAHKR